MVGVGAAAAAPDQGGYTSGKILALAADQALGSVGRPHLGIAQPVTCRTCGQYNADQGQRQAPFHLQSLMHCHILQTGLVLVCASRESITTPWPKRRLT